MNLTDLVKKRQLSHREAFDILTSLAVLIDEGVYSGIFPENIEVKSNYEVKINDAVACNNAYFMAPEQLFHGVNDNKNSALFSFGMIYYFVLSSKIWYLAQSVKVYQIQNSEIQIVQPYSLFADINKLVSHTPEERIKGFVAFFRQAESHPKGKVLISYDYEGQTIAQESFQLENEMDNYAANKKIKTPGGDVFIVENGVDIISRFTDQSVTIPVRLYKSASDKTFEIRLQIDNDTENRISLFEFGDVKKEVVQPISLGRIRKISFWKMLVDSHGRVLEEKHLREIKMPRIKNEALIVISFDNAHSQVTVSLFNNSKSQRIVAKDLWFNIDAE